MKLKLSIFVALTLFLVSSSSYAQQQNSYEPTRPQQFGPPPHGGPEHNMGNKQHHKEDLAKQLNLTEEQKQKLETQRKADMKEIKPVLDEMFAKKQEYDNISHSTTLSSIEKETKMLKLKADMKELKTKADLKRNENMQKFEDILTPEQKTKFQEIKAKQKEQMEQMKQKGMRPST